MNRSRARLRLLLVTGTAVVLALSAAPTLAAPLDRDSFVEVDTGTEEVCGEEWDVVTTNEGHYIIKDGHDGDPTPYYFDNTSERSVFTDPDDPARGFVSVTKSVFKDVRITLISGTTYRFETMHTGYSSLESLGGRPVARDQGQSLWAFIIDTKGGNDLDAYEILDEDLLRVTGRQSLPVDDDAYCALVEEAIGD